ncbi:MAG: hypothetical protein KKD44_29145 [Proteobacteria bacterium]|nr:hypothetical protein [Pseudomonadota bacterium]
MNAADRILRRAETLGWELARHSFAQTGTQYLLFERADEHLQIRIADHMECYPPQRGIRQLSISPHESDIEVAFEALADPKIVPVSQGAAPLDANQIETLRDQRAHAASFKVRWQELRAGLAQPDFDEFLAHGKNRPAARAIAERLGLGAGLVYAALTNGRKWTK